MTDSPDPIDAFLRVREALLAAADAVAPSQRRTPFVGHWHLMDLIAHLAGWDYTNIEAIEALKAGRPPSFYEHYDPQWVTFNQQLIQRYGADDWRLLRESLQSSQDAVLKALRAISAAELTKQHDDPNRPRPITIAGILRAALRDEQEHLEQIKAFLASMRD